MKIYNWLAVILAMALLLCMAGCGKEDASVGDDGASEPPQISGDDGQYTVTFYSDNGTILKMESVEPNGAATPPVEPQMTYGNVFTAWDTDFTEVTEDLQVRPLSVEFTGKPNAFAVSSAYGRVGEKVSVPVRLCGDVCVCGFDITIAYDAAKLELVSVVEDGAVIYNDDTPGAIRLNYVGAENTIADVDVCFLQFEVLEAFDSASVSVVIHGIYAFNNSMESQDDSMYVPETTVIDGMVYVIQ